MIRVTRLDGSEVTINCDLVESIERTPDTVISLLNGHKLVVRETVGQLIEQVVRYRRDLLECPFFRNVPGSGSRQELHTASRLGGADS